MTRIRSSVKLAKKSDRENYKEALSTYLETVNEEDLATLKAKLKIAAENARPIDDINMVLSNRMQFTGLLTLEAEFLIAISKKVNDENKEEYLGLHKSLFGSDSDFKKSIKPFLPF